MSSRIVKVGTTDEFSDRQPVVWRQGELAIAVVRLGSKFFAVDDRCPHAGASLARGEVSDATISCRIHHWSFCLKSGRYLDSVQTSSSDYDLTTYPVTVENDDVFVQLPEENPNPESTAML